MPRPFITNYNWTQDMVSWSQLCWVTLATLSAGTQEKIKIKIIMNTCKICQIR